MIRLCETQGPCNTNRTMERSHNTTRNRRFAVFLRAVNVGGTGKLAMQDLRRLCEECGFEQIKTYIASGNVAVSTTLSATEIAVLLEAKLQTFAGRPVGVFVRSAAELKHIVEANPFPQAKDNQVSAILLDTDAEQALSGEIKGQRDEVIIAGQGALYVHYPSGMGTSKLRIRGAEHGTARNMNTMVKMAGMTAEV